MAPAVNVKLKGTEVEIYGLTGAVHLNGQRGKLNGVLQGDRLGVDLPCGTKALRTSNIRILDDSATAVAPSPPSIEIHSGLDAISSRPDISCLHACHLFADALYTACVSGTPGSFERLPVNMQDLLNLERQVKSGVHMLHVAIDAVAHQLVLEYSCGAGWRVFQSFVKPGPLSTHVGGYTGLDWIATAAVGSASPVPHETWGQGQVVSRENMVQLLALIHMMRSLVDEVVEEELLRQLPFEKPATSFEKAFQSWVDYMNNVTGWSSEKLSNVSRGISFGKRDDHLELWMGLQDDFAEDEVFLKISSKRADVLGGLYTRITGEVLRPPVWLSMVQFAFHRHARSEQGAIGWAYRTGCVWE